MSGSLTPVRIPLMAAFAPNVRSPFLHSAAHPCHACPPSYPSVPDLQAERYVCSVPRERYSLLGHRAALVLAVDSEAGDGFASFLKQATGSEAQEVGV